MGTYSALRNSAMSMACIAFSSVSAKTWLYTSRVVRVLTCPSRFATTFAVKLPFINMKKEYLRLCHESGQDEYNDALLSFASRKGA